MPRIIEELLLRPVRPVGGEVSVVGVELLDIEASET